MAEELSTSPAPPQAEEAYMRVRGRDPEGQLVISYTTPSLEVLIHSIAGRFVGLEEGRADRMNTVDAQILAEKFLGIVGKIPEGLDLPNRILDIRKGSNGGKHIILLEDPMLPETISPPDEVSPVITEMGDITVEVLSVEYIARALAEVIAEEMEAMYSKQGMSI